MPRIAWVCLTTSSASRSSYEARRLKLLGEVVAESLRCEGLSQKAECNQLAPFSRHSGRIDMQIVELYTLLLKSQTVVERHRATDELAYLQIERRNVAGKMIPE